MKKESIQNPSGITLIALIITIIVLLLLAGISLSMVSGNNGVLNQATGAVSETRKRTVQEEITLAWTSCYNEYFADWSMDFTKQKKDYFTQENLQKYLETKGTVSDLEYSPNGASNVI